jgi:hypothetical protein
LNPESTVWSLDSAASLILIATLIASFVTFVPSW